MGAFRDITGQRFGKLIAIEPSDRTDNHGGVIWLCECDCGNIKYARSDNLLSGSTTSCGCEQRALPYGLVARSIPRYRQPHMLNKFTVQQYLSNQDQERAAARMNRFEKYATVYRWI